MILFTGSTLSKKLFSSCAVNYVYNYADPQNVIISSFSNYGPTDDEE
jgi:hypothetical protein